MPRSRGPMLIMAAARGALCGLAGVAVMTAGEKVEQSLTGRVNSYLPARTLRTLFGGHPDDSPQSPVWNHLMHWGTGAALGSLRGIWAVTGIRGPVANTQHTIVRLAFDQTLENATGAGAPPTSWPAREQIIDLAHKAVYAFATGLAADRWIKPLLESRRGTTSH